MNRDFGNEQDMAVADKEHPTLGPTEGSQDVESLPRQVVPMPAFNDPNNPIAASGSVNLSLNDTPVKHSEDYGAAVLDDYGHDHVESPISEGSKALRQFDLSSASVDAQEAVKGLDGAPESRDEWTKAHWQSAARAYELPVSGNLATLKERVEGYEGEIEERDKWEAEVRGLNREDLDGVAKDHGLDPEAYSRKEDLADAVIATAYGEEVQPGDKTTNGS